MPDYKPQKPVAPWSAKAMYRKTAVEMGGPLGVAQRIGVKRSQAYAFGDPNSPSHASADHLLACVGAGAREPVHRFCAAAGGYFVPGEAVTATVPELASRAAREHGAMLAASIEVMADGVITPREAAQLAEHVDSTTRALVSLRNKIAEGL